MGKKREITIRRRVPLSPNAPENIPVVPLPPRRRHRHLLRTLLRLLLVAALLGGGYLLWKNREALTPDSVLVWLEETFQSGAAGEGFPVPVTGNTVLQMQEIDGSLVMLNDTTLVMLSAKGGESVRRPHGFLHPILKTAGKYALVAETGGKRLRLETRVKTVREYTTKYPIISASVNARGAVAVVTTADQSYSTEIIVFGENGKEIYQRSRKWLAVDVAVSPDSREVAVASITGEGGALNSHVEVFRFTKEETNPLISYKDAGILICALAYQPSGKLVAVGDTALWTVDPHGTQFEKQPYGNYQLLQFAVSNDETAVALLPVGQTAGGELRVIKGDGTLALTTNFTASFRHMAAGDNRFLLLTRDTLYTVENDTLADPLPVPADGLLTTPFGRKNMVLGLSSVQEYAGNKK